MRRSPPVRSGHAAAALAAAVALSVTLSGCSSLLPNADAQTQVRWETFNEARDMVEKIVPYQTKRADLITMGIDPYSNPSVTILNYSDILQRFAAGSVITPEELDRGIRQCLAAGKRCTGYSIAVKHSNRRRVGNFWLDSLGFRRETEVTGWSFNALVLLVDDVAVHTLFGGQPNVYEREVTRNPLGPLQSWGDQVPALVR